MGSFFFFFSDRPGAAVVPPPRRGAPVQTVIAINPQFEVGFAFADVPGLGRVPAGRGGGVKPFTFRLICTGGTFAAWFSNELGSYMIGLMIG